MHGAGIALNTMTKSRHDKDVTIDVIGKICKTLGADYGDNMKYVSVRDEC